MANTKLFIILVITVLIPLTSCKSNADTNIAETYYYDEYHTDMKIIENSLVDKGDTNRIISVMQKAINGEDITIGFIGGSITWGASAKTKNESYAHLIYKWWVKKFPNVKIRKVNAGLSGTGSVLGAHRIENDLLSRDPDFVILEFAVNDVEGRLPNEAYENMTRAILSDENNPGLMMLFMTLQNGYNTQEAKTITGLHYNIPMISYRDGIMPSIDSEEMVWTDISPDFIHPNSTGHQIIAEMIIYQLEKYYAEIESETRILTDLPAPHTQASFEHTTFYTNKTITPITLGGFEINDHAYWNIPEGWKAIEANKPMIIEVMGKSIGLIYNQTTDFKGANVSVTINNNEPVIITSHSPYTYDYLNTHIVYESNEVTLQRIKIELLDIAPIGCSGENFSLLGVLTSE